MSIAVAAPVINPHEAVKKVTTIATLPEVTAKIIATVENPKSSAQELHKIVSHDPALVTRILKVVNSAFYGLPGQIGSIERAIVLLGLNAVKNIAVAASLGQLFRGAKLSDTFSAKDLWRHCIAVGVASRDLAKQMKLPMAEEAFLAGMIHDMGILVSMQLWPEQIRAVCDRASHAIGASDAATFCEMEREMIGADHQQLGLALAEQWKFPQACQLVAGNHHNPSALGGQSRLLVSVVYAADTICCQSKHGFNLTAINQKLDSAGLDDVKIDRALIERTAANLDELVEVASSVLG
ncbi:HDOD domain-containing protein [Humisphaera borealis]|uniref:HDOD domain-containing protein n=1 Tax=Humisphaera borealis TaxID=2807512 RepID=A0A7M2X224_9BACT|nr:HDOD domain-containing protein [Humisphaera borealis]QOV91763.1 HDOD domain-containing protein [Humisphaera borealis]